MSAAWALTPANSVSAFRSASSFPAGIDGPAERAVPGMTLKSPANVRSRDVTSASVGRGHDHGGRDDGEGDGDGDPGAGGSRHV